jgi:hypothetical protein
MDHQNQNLRKNKFGNFEHFETGLVFQSETETVYGKQNENGKVDILTDDDIEQCKKFKFNYKLPDNLNTNKDLNNIKIDEVEDEDEDDEDEDEDKEEDCDNNENESDEEILGENEEYNDSEIEELEDEGVENHDDYEPTEESVFKLNNDSNELESLVVEDEVVEDFTGVRDVVDVTEEVEVKPETINLEEQQPSVITQDQKDLFKTISITSLEEDGIRIVETQDYKKMSLPKLKQVAVEKKLVADASKLKKSDIFKLLGVEV